MLKDHHVLYFVKDLVTTEMEKTTKDTEAVRFNESYKRFVRSCVHFTQLAQNIAKKTPIMAEGALTNSYRFRIKHSLTLR